MLEMLRASETKKNILLHTSLHADQIALVWHDPAIHAYMHAKSTGK
jgi:hypothetical protein